MSLGVYRVYLQNLTKHVKGYTVPALSDGAQFSDLVPLISDINEMTYVDDFMNSIGQPKLFLPTKDFLHDLLPVSVLSRLENSEYSPELKSSILSNLGALADPNYQIPDNVEVVPSSKAEIIQDYTFEVSTFEPESEDHLDVYEGYSGDDEEESSEEDEEEEDNSVFDEDDEDDEYESEDEDEDSEYDEDSEDYEEEEDSLEDDGGSDEEDEFEESDEEDTSVYDEDDPEEDDSEESDEDNSIFDEDEEEDFEPLDDDEEEDTSIYDEDDPEEEEEEEEEDNSIFDEDDEDTPEEEPEDEEEEEDTSVYDEDDDDSEDGSSFGGGGDSENGSYFSDMKEPEYNPQDFYDELDAFDGTNEGVPSTKPNFKDKSSASPEVNVHSSNSKAANSGTPTVPPKPRDSNDFLASLILKADQKLTTGFKKATKAVSGVPSKLKNLTFVEGEED